MGTRTVSQTINLQTPDQTSKYISADNSGLMIYDGRAGIQQPSNPTSTTRNVFIDDNSVDVRLGTNVLAVFGADGAQIGKDDETHLEMDYHSLQLKEKDGDSFFQVSDLRDKTGIAELTQKYIQTEPPTWPVETSVGLDFEAYNTTYTNSIHVFDDDDNDVTSQYSVYSYGLTYFALRPALEENYYVEFTYQTAEPVMEFTFGRRDTTSIGGMSFAAGIDVLASGIMSYAEGLETIASAYVAHAEGSNTEASGEVSHAEGIAGTASGQASHAEGISTKATDAASHAEGSSSQAKGTSSHAEGHETIAYGGQSHAEGILTQANGNQSHAEGRETQANGNQSHAEGYQTQANEHYAHAEGRDTIASGLAAHAEGNESTADGMYSHAEGTSEAYGNYSHAQNHTIAHGRAQTTLGEYNIEETGASEQQRGTYVVIIGNGSPLGESNALTIDWSGNVVASGDVTATGDIYISIDETAAIGTVDGDLYKALSDAGLII